LLEEEWWEVVLEKRPMNGSLVEGYETTLEDFSVKMSRSRRCRNQELEGIGDDGVVADSE
jgi:hypothetical protein